ncbi:hypothetical protein PV328_012342, partial [Microctonus aethiopoides]
MPYMHAPYPPPYGYYPPYQPYHPPHYQQPFNRNFNPRKNEQRPNSPYAENKEIPLNSQVARQVDAMTSSPQTQRPSTVKFITIEEMYDGQKDADTVHESMTISGITPEKITTAGSTELTFFENPEKFQVLKDELPIPADGIIGMDFLKNEK